MCLRRAVILVCVLSMTAALAGCASASRAREEPGRERDNRELVRAAFERWRQGTGGPFELLADDAEWTITGSSPVSGTYRGKEEFMARVIRPFNARMERPLKPEVRGLYADGDSVVIHFDAESLCIDGRPYRNTYAWFMRFEDGRAEEVTAFFDTRLFDEMWTRVTPR